MPSPSIDLPTDKRSGSSWCPSAEDKPKVDVGARTDLPGKSELQSLASLELQLEQAFAQLRERLQAVREEVGAQGATAVTEAPGRKKKKVSGRKSSKETVFGVGGEGEILSPKASRPDDEPVLEVPEVLRDVWKQRQATMDLNVSIAAARARATAQATDLANQASSEAHDLRLHPRWMELVTKSSQMMQQASSRSSTSARRVSVRALHRKSSKERYVSEGEKLQTSIQTWCAGDFFGSVFLPHAPSRLAWDVAGLCLILLDALLLPVSLAWDLTIEPADFGGIILFLAFWIALLYWFSDVAMNFNTGFYQSGRLVVSRASIACHYLRGWLAFDLLLVSIDVATAVDQFGSVGSSDQGGSSAVLRSVRSFRVLRAMRLLRLLKMSRLSAVIEEASVAAGRQWLVLVVAILKTTCAMMVCAHVLACFWFYLGRWRIESGEQSWIELSDAENVPGPVQYLHAFQWILTPPAPLPVSPDSAVERLYCIVIVAATVVVIGSALSKITGTLQELRTINSEGSRKRREVRQYLQAQQVSVELTSRIMRFVDYKLERQSSVSLDHSLLSPSLHIELHVSQRGGLLQPHPMFSLTNEAFPEVFASICGAVEKQVFGKMEFVFTTDSWAQCMYITATGTFSMCETEDTNEMTLVTTHSNNSTVFSGCHWFAESALFAEAVVHDTSLRAETFGEAFSLTGADLAQCLMNSPTCTAMFCEYAKELLSQLRRAIPLPNFNQSTAEECSFNSVKQNSFYLELHPDPKTMLENVDLSKVGVMREEPENEDGNEAESEVIAIDLDVEAVAEPEPSPGYSAFDLAQQVLADQVSSKDLLAKLRESMPELDPDRGSHALLSQAGERERSESCCLSIIALVAGSFEDYTYPQAEKVRLTGQQWAHLQRLTRWTRPDAEKLHAVLVLLSVRSLGKSKRVAQQLPTSSQRPEQALLYLMRNLLNVVPSVKTLSTSSFHLIEEVLEVHQDFNLAQMLQGENVAGNVLQLQELIKEKGVEVFRFYIFFLLGFMSGLAGGQGSRFMNSKNAESSVTGMLTLLHVLDSSAQAVYWSFITVRAEQLSLPANTPEDIALVRMACLGRIQDQKGFLQLRLSWELLGLRERQVLVRHFLADGIEEQAFVFEFLPLCVANARENKHVSVHVLLEVLVDLIENLNQLDVSKLPQTSPRLGQVKMVSVDLSDMAEFISAVQNRFIFQTSVSRCKIRFQDNRWHLMMTSGNWARTHEADSDTTTLAYSVKELLQRQKFLHEMVVQNSQTTLQSGFSV